MRFNGFDLKELHLIELQFIFFGDKERKQSHICGACSIYAFTYRFEKKFVNRDVVCCSGGFFWPNIGVDGAEPRRHAFSYDVSVSRKKRGKKLIFFVQKYQIKFEN